MKRYFKSTMIITDGYFDKLSNEQINKKLETYYTQTTNVDVETLRKYGKKINFDVDGPINIYRYKNKTYINPKPPHKRKGLFIKRKQISPFEDPKIGFLEEEKIVFQDNLDNEKIKYFWLFLLFVIDFLLLWFYFFIFKKLKPLLKLKDAMNKFSKGSLNIDTKVDGKDEIAQVSNEFNNAITKIRELNESRKLFLRNILHEFKTPITKGKLVTDTLENDKKRIVLQKAFQRLEYLLEEFLKLEELTSGKINLDIKEYRIVDLLDQAFDILLVDKSKIDIYPSNTKVYVDYEVFSIALKNLIDNAMRYNTNGKPKIVIKEDSIIIKNKGKPLKKIFEEYLKPFNREYESIDKGLGLGLYITNSIIENHKFKLYYFYNEEYHIFKIQLKDNYIE